MKRLVFMAVAILLVGTGVRGGNAPSVRNYPELNAETKIWVEQIQQVMTSGQAIKIQRKEAGSQERFREILGPYLPLEKVGGVEINPDGSFLLTLIKEHVIDLPTDDPKGENKFIRVTFKEGKVKGRFVETKTLRKAIAVKLLAFMEPHTITIDPLNAKRESTVPGIAKMMGMLPKIIALVYHEGEKGPLVAPQLNGMGTSENPRLMKDLCFVDDTVF